MIQVQCYKVRVSLYIGHVEGEHQHHSRARSPMEAAAPAEPNAVKAKKEDKEFTYERVADDEATLEEEEKMEQGDVKVRVAQHTRATHALRLLPMRVMRLLCLAEGADEPGGGGEPAD